MCDYKNKNWLYDQYWTKKKSLTEIGNMCHVSNITIKYWMLKFGIERRTTSESSIGRILSIDSRKKISDARKGISFSEEHKQKLSEVKKKYFEENNSHNKGKGNLNALYLNKEWLYKTYVEKEFLTGEIAEMCDVSNGTILRWLTNFEIPIRNRSENSKLFMRKNNPWRERKHTEDSRKKMSEAKKGRKVGPPDLEQRKRISAGRQGIPLEEWDSFISFEPYCEKFNEDKKEEIRNRDGRVCRLCGKTEIENKQRLTVHHINGDKTQGCESRWYLAAICRSCNGKKDTIKKEFLIVTNQF
ncbi:MAG: hypothetical protein GOV02_01335 [Candidatus Aenigmarchaeota archaeon]|nr:hypothetical protein [Candidatus Aenigmarchaeota archaeon]